MTRLVQIQKGSTRRIARVQEPHLSLLDGVNTIYELAAAAATANIPLPDLIRRHTSAEQLAYAPIYAGTSEWRLLPPIDHPHEPSRCLVSGTGLTHLGSAKNRQAMHSASEAELNDSMKIFRWGLERGRPAPGDIGVAPEWFYKGSGTILRAPNEPLDWPAYAEDGGEEAEIVGIYIISPDGQPRRIGMTAGNEFSDHKFEKRNYLNLAGSKLRTCAIGPELVVDPDFKSVPGVVTIERAGKILWSLPIQTGEEEMCHSLANIEHHHFKFEAHRRPGDLHVHYFGAVSLSFGAGIQLMDGDVMKIEFDGFGRPLRNPLRIAQGPPELITVQPMS